MSFAGKAKPVVFVNPFLERVLHGQALEELKTNSQREDLWVKALRKSRRDEQKARALYVEYRTQTSRAEAARANVLAEEPSDIIIQRYLTNVVSQKPRKGPKRRDKPNNLPARSYHRKRCFKCRKVVLVAVGFCPECHCNSFIFCR